MRDTERTGLFTIFNYLEAQIKLFHVQLEKINNIHQARLTNKDYNSSNPDDMREELEALFQKCNCTIKNI